MSGVRIAAGVRMALFLPLLGTRGLEAKKGELEEEEIARSAALGKGFFSLSLSSLSLRFAPNSHALSLSYFLFVSPLERHVRAQRIPFLNSFCF